MTRTSDEICRELREEAAELDWDPIAQLLIEAAEALSAGTADADKWRKLQELPRQERIAVAIMAGKD